MARANTSSPVDRWLSQGMPERCAPPSTEDGWVALLRLLPGYDPFDAAGDCEFDVAAALRAIGFFHDCIKHTKGSKRGQPLWLEPWQQAIVANLFGWKRPDGTRRYRRFFVKVPRKNGKTTLVAGLALCVLTTDGEPGAECYCAAADRDQARLVFDQAKGMVSLESELDSRNRIYTNSIVYDGASALKVISAEASTKHGYNTHFGVIDELHAQPNRELWDVLDTSTASRTQPLFGAITTEDFDRESICNEVSDYAEKVCAGVIDDPAFLPAVWGADRDDDWTDPAVWAKANPNLGVSVSREYIEAACKKAQETPSFENTFKRLHLNIRTEQDVRWLALAAWDACDMPVVEDALAGQLCYAGLDLSTTTDISAFVMAFPDDEGFRLVGRFWIPSDGAHAREKRDRVPYAQWAREGWIKMTPGNVVDYDVIRADINELNKRYGIKQIAADRWNATQLITQLGGDGFDVMPFGQGYASMSGPAKEFEKLVLGGRLGHGGNPVLRWMASSVAIETDAAGNIKPSKKKSTERIDGIVASVMAIGAATLAQGPTTSVYEQRGLLVLE